MKIQNALKIVAALTIGTAAGTSFAHEGHAMAGTHWHATDVWGFVALGVMVVVAIWFSKNRK